MDQASYTASNVTSSITNEYKYSYSRRGEVGPTLRLMLTDQAGESETMI